MQLSSQSLNDSCGMSYRLLAVRIQPPNSCLYGEGVVNQHSWGNALVCVRSGNSLRAYLVGKGECTCQAALLDGIQLKVRSWGRTEGNIL